MPSTEMLALYGAFLSALTLTLVIAQWLHNEAMKRHNARQGAVIIELVHAIHQARLSTPALTTIGRQFISHMTPSRKSEALQTVDYTLLNAIYDELSKIDHDPE